LPLCAIRVHPCPTIYFKGGKIVSLEFNADEIFQMALQIERNGVRFYQRAAEGAGNPAGRQLLLRLAAMEETHEKIFVRMREGLTEKERKKPVYDPADQSSDYLRAWADQHVFNLRSDPSEKLTGKETMESVLQTAIGLEKDSIVFYLGMKDVVPERLGRGKIEEVIKEEMRHVDSLSREFQTLRHQPF
jgi:rubrerythrin